MHKKTLLLIISTFIFMAYGCAPVYTPQDAQINDQGIVVEIQHVEQLESYSCGAASLEMVSNYWGNTIKQKDLNATASEQIRKSGFSIGELKANAINSGFKAVSFAGSMKILKEQLSKGRPVIVALSLPYNRTVKSPFLRKFPASKGAAFFMENYSHYVVVVGITVEEIIVMDPLTGIDIYSHRDFEKHWQERSRASLIISS
jgi:ABC-type bacteriocin/lantibiotic exporter with double-glycine peptidase domain